MSTLAVDIPDELAEEFNRLFANVDRDAIVTALLVDLLDRVSRLPSASQVIADNPDLPIGFVLDLLEARAEGRQSAVPFLPGVQVGGFEGDIDDTHHRGTVNGRRFDGLPREQC